MNGLFTGMHNLHLLAEVQTRSISAENFSGEKGKGGMAATGNPASRDLGIGWKVSPCVTVKPGQVFTVADIAASGAIQHVWMTPTGNWRFSILRIYWDDQSQ